jgi:uncharacterized protein YkwD
VRGSWTRPALATLAGIVLFLLSGSVGAGLAAGDVRAILTAADGVERPTITLINEIRQEAGLKPLRFSIRLAEAAEAHAFAMGREGFFSHESADGTIFWKRVAKWYGSRGFAHWTVGENLLWASPTVSPEQAVKLWLDSAPHRRVLLSPRWTQIGLAAIHVRNGTGVYNGLEVTIVTADFGARY